MKENYTKNSLFAIDALFSTITGFKKVFGVNKMILVLLLFFVQAVVFGANITTSTSGNWSSPSTWAGGVVPGPNDNVIVNHAVILDVDIKIGTGDYTFNANVTDNGSHTLTAITSGGVLIISNSSTTTFGGAVALDNSLITVNSGSTLVTGAITIDNGTSINIVGSLEVNGNVTDNNNGSGGGFAVAGYVQINGNYNAPVGNVQVTGAGVFQTTGTIITNGNSTVGGSTNNCTTGPCSSGSISCEGSKDISQTSSISPSNQSLCSGQAILPLTFSSSASTSSYQWQKSTTNGGLGFADISGATSSSYQPLSVTAWYRVKYSTSNCSGLTSPSVKVTVNPLPTAPTFALVDIKQPDCKLPTGSVILRGLPPSGTINQTGTVINTYPITGSTITISGLTPGTYNFSVFVGGCSSSPSGNVVIDPVTTATWNVVSGVGSWTDGPPSLSKALVFDGNYSENTDVVGCSCEVKSGTIKILDGKTMTITNGVSVSGGASLIFENNASLVQINDAAVNVGNITYKRLTKTVVRNTDYTYWSTPVSPLNLGGTGGISYNPSSLVGSIFYSYEVTAGSEDWKGESATSPMIVGKGYSIRGPGPISYSPISLLEATFTGRPNNGRYPITGINPFKSYLLGNPYPSALDADKFLTDNADVIDGTLYFWTHSTKIGIGVVNPGTGVYAYSGDDYASYNLTGGVGTDGVAYPQGGVQAPSSPGFKPTGKIGAGQGFFATSNTTIKGANEIVFNNSMRVGVGGITGDNSQFFKTNSTKSKTTSAIEKNRVWLNLTNTQGAFKQLLVGYITGATNDYDNGYDGETFDGNEFLDFYSVNQEKNFVIQGRALPFDVNDEVSLGYRSVAAGDFSIGIDEVDGVILSQKVFIEDKLLNVAHDLKASPYDFTTQAGTFNDRFVLHYKDKTLGADDFDKTENQVLISKDKNDLKIKSELENIKRITVFDLFGRKVFDKEVINSNELSISNSTLNKQIVIVKVILANGNVISKKVIY